MTTKLTPWWDVLRLRAEIREGRGAIDDLQMSLFSAVHGLAGKPSRYHDPGYYGEITHPSPNLTELLGKVLVRLGGGDRHTAAGALWRLEQSMGGGKSHGLIGLWHMAAHPQAMRETDIGREAFATAEQITGAPIAKDLGCPQVVVLCCDSMTAGRGDLDLDGPAQTLYERFLYRLFRGPGGCDMTLYDRFQPYLGDKGKLAEALAAVGRPVLILVDEILDYIRQLQETRHADLATRDMAFLRALLDVVNDVPLVAMVLVMIGSDKDVVAMDERGQKMRTELESLLVRNAKTATVTSNTDFAAILRRRLFENQASAELISATTNHFQKAVKGPWQQKVFASLPRASAHDFADEVTRCYPFHPMLMTLAEQEWAPMAGFQKVRSTISIFAAAAYVLSQRGQNSEWAPLLIGIGDLPLSLSQVREAIIDSGLITDRRSQNNYRQLASTDIVNDDDKSGAARTLDRTRDGELQKINPRAAERAATALFLYSVVGPRGQGRQGATEAELKAATFVPNQHWGLTEADSILMELRDTDRGLSALETIDGRGGQPPRMYLSTKQTVNMLFRSARATVTDADRDDEFAKVVKALMTGKGAKESPFKERLFISAKSDEKDNELLSLHEILARADLDHQRSTRLVALDARRFSLQNGADQETRSAIRAALGIGEEKLPVQWASSCVFALVNTRLRTNARGAVVTSVAWNRVCDMNSVKNDPELLEGARKARDDAQRAMENAIRLAYQHVIYLCTGEDGQGRIEKELRFEHENQSALDGELVWKKLAEEEKVFQKDEFDDVALLHNLLEDDYGRPLDELRNLFWTAPRMPLLPGGDMDLQNAIYKALKKGSLRLVSGDGTDQVVTTAGSIGIGSAALRLARPVRKESTPEKTYISSNRGESDLYYKRVGPKSGEYARDSGDGSNPRTSEDRAGVQLSTTINTALTDDARRHAVFKLINQLAICVDEAHASHLKITVNVALSEAEAAQLGDLIREAGGVPATTPL